MKKNETLSTNKLHAARWPRVLSLTIIILCLLGIFLPSVHAQNAPVDKITPITVKMEIEGEYDTAGDEFLVIISVQNVGSAVTAYDVQGAFRDIPDGWVVTPATLNATFGDIAPGHVAQHVWKIVRDEEDATIGFGAKGSNTNRAHSGSVNVPVHPAILLAFAGIVLSSALRRPTKG